MRCINILFVLGLCIKIIRTLESYNVLLPRSTADEVTIYFTLIFQMVTMTVAWMKILNIQQENLQPRRWGLVEQALEYLKRHHPFLQQRHLIEAGLLEQQEEEESPEVNRFPNLSHLGPHHHQHRTQLRKVRQTSTIYYALKIGITVFTFSHFSLYCYTY